MAVLFTLPVIILAALLAYFTSLSRDLERSFTEQAEFVPTRVYSDVTRIAPAGQRQAIETQLKSRGYAAQISADSIQFTLNAIQYPAYLVPDGHPSLGAGGKSIALFFDGEKPNSMLRSIQIAGEEVPDLFLEPELVATLARGSQEIRKPVAFQDIPSHVWKAILSIEDPSFLDHKGFSMRGIARAMWINLKTLSFSQGGSTITQQLVKNLTGRSRKTIVRKLNELFLAIWLEARYEKEQILERYLNEVNLGQVGAMEVRGVFEGARYFFGKNLEDITLAEAALMAGIIRGPDYYAPHRHWDRAHERSVTVLKKMHEHGQIAEDELALALKEKVRLAPPQTAGSRAPFFTDFVKAELIRELKDRYSEEDLVAAGLRVYTTLDTYANQIAQRAVSEGITDLEKRLKLPETQRLEGALAAVDHTTGYIRALVGGRNYGQSNFNRVLNMRRQVGSTFKPVVYLAAYNGSKDKDGIPYTPAYPIEDLPWKLVYDQGRQNWSPKNYVKGHAGWLTLRSALAHSINTVSAQLGVRVGLSKIISTARDLGIDTPLPEVPSLSLGVAELSPVELLRVYSAIANGGLLEELTVIRGVTQNDGTGLARFVHHPKTVADPGAVALLADTLTGVFSDGTATEVARALKWERPSAGKTGTTSNHRDAWFAGFTPQLTAVAWVGSDLDNGGSKWNLTGGGSALPIWIKFMQQTLVSEPPLLFGISPNTGTFRVDRYTGAKATLTCSDSQTVIDKFAVGMEPTTETCAASYPESVRETHL